MVICIFFLSSYVWRHQKIQSCLWKRTPHKIMRPTEGVWHVMTITNKLSDFCNPLIKNSSKVNSRPGRKVVQNVPHRKPWPRPGDPAPPQPGSVGAGVGGCTRIQGPGDRQWTPQDAWPHRRRHLAQVSCECGGIWIVGVGAGMSSGSREDFKVVVHTVEAWGCIRLWLMLMILWYCTFFLPYYYCSVEEGLHENNIFI